MKIDILAFGAHPDDVELSCCGTLIKHMEAGYTVGIIDLTQGELGSRGSGELRLIEAENSRKIMGAVVRENLGLPDGFFSHPKALEVHKITHDEALKNGIPIIDIFKKMKTDLINENIIVGYNVKFDWNITRSEAYRYNDLELFEKLNSVNVEFFTFSIYFRF